MYLEELRQLVVNYGKKMSHAGLSTGTSGNISILDRESGHMAISPSGIGYFDTTCEDVVIMDLEGNVVDGTRKPSSEWALHTAMYKAKPKANAVVHTHSVYCCTFAALHQPLRAVHYVIADAEASTIPCAPYETFGSQALVDTTMRRLGKSNAILLANHGLLTCGSTLKSAYSLARNMEFVAEVQYRAMSIGTPQILSAEDMDVVMEEFTTYGQNDGKTGY